MPFPDSTLSNTRSVSLTSMYKLMLILKYVLRKITPMFAALAVTLCTAMVIIVISVMDGFLDLMRVSARKLTGDVTIHGDVRGFAHYEELISELRQLPEIAAATPVIRAYGLLMLNERQSMIEILGIESEGMDAVTGYRQTLYWTVDRLERDLASRPPSSDQQAEIERERKFYQTYALDDRAMQFDPPAEWVSPDASALSGIVIGIEISAFNHRNDAGRYEIATNRSLGGEAWVTLVRVGQAGKFKEPAHERFIVVNEFKSGLYEIDANRAYVPFEDLQRLLNMEMAQGVDDEGNLDGRRIAARTNEVVVKGRTGVPLARIALAVQDVVDRLMGRYTDIGLLTVQTWEQRHRTLLQAVQNEKGLITFLFVIISVVAFVMVATTFYNIVLDKTHDVGVLRALGASRMGIANVFMGYGLAIGVFGAAAGLGLAVAIVTHLNEIQEAIYQFTFWSSEGAWAWRMWDPRVYYFDHIPDTVDYAEARWIMLGSVISCEVGALIPAILAARVNPVESLRYE